MGGGVDGWTNEQAQTNLGGGGGGGGGGGMGYGGRGRWMDKRTGPNQFAPSTSSKLGA